MDFIENMKKERAQTKNYAEESDLPAPRKMLIEPLKNAPSIPDRVKPDPEWVSRLLQWFSYLRIHMMDYRDENTIPFTDLLRSIECQCSPDPRELFNTPDTEKILNKFSEQTEFTVIDLEWIFGALCATSRLLQPSACECVQKILTTCLIQINKNEYSPDVPKLIVIAALISNFFHQPPACLPN